MWHHGLVFKVANSDLLHLKQHATNNIFCVHASTHQRRFGSDQGCRSQHASLLATYAADTTATSSPSSCRFAAPQRGGGRHLYSGGLCKEFLVIAAPVSACVPRSRPTREKSREHTQAGPSVESTRVLTQAWCLRQNLPSVSR